VARWLIEKRIDTEGEGRALVVVRLADPATVDPVLLERIIESQKRVTREERRAGESGPPVRKARRPKEPAKGRDLRALIEQLATPNVVRVRACARCSAPAFTGSPWCLRHAPSGSLP
jgi:hypothetical protein